MGLSSNIHHGLEFDDNKFLVQVLHQDNIHHGPQSSNKESLILVNHYHYKRRSNGFPHFAFIIYYQATIRRTCKNQYNYLT
jgi:hypothetical protein